MNNKHTKSCIFYTILVPFLSSYERFFRLYILQELPIYKHTNMDRPSPETNQSLWHILHNWLKSILKHENVATKWHSCLMSWALTYWRRKGERLFNLLNSSLLNCTKPSWELFSFFFPSTVLYYGTLQTVKYLLLWRVIDLVFLWEP